MSLIFTRQSSVNMFAPPAKRYQAGGRLVPNPRSTCNRKIWVTCILKLNQMETTAQNKFQLRIAIQWFFFVILLVVGVLNLVLVHPVPGIVYLFLALLCLPWTNTFLMEKFNFKIPFAVQIVLFLLFMWYSLAMGEVWEML